MTDNVVPDPSVEQPADTRDKDGYRGGRSTDDIVVAPNAPAALVALAERTGKTIEDAVPANTRRAYEGDLRRFADWCTVMGFVAMPAAPQTIIIYMRALADRELRISTIERALAAISTAHVRARLPSPWNDPLVDDMRVALRRELGVRPKKKRAAVDDVLRRLVGVLLSSRLGVRDRSLLTMGWAGAFRRSELVQVKVGNITICPKGLLVLIESSKTDQEKRGEEIPMFYSNDPALCPVRSLHAWLAAAGITEGPIFRALGRNNRVSTNAIAASTVADRVKQYAKLAGLDPRDFAGHSLRSGFVTTARRRGRDSLSIRRTTRHSTERSLDGYYQPESVFEGAAGEGLL